MAFVYRAKRDIKITDIESNNAFPGEYYKEHELIKDIDKQSSEFQSNTKRDMNSNQLITPGPGSYEKDVVYYDAFNDLHKKKKNTNIFDAVKNNAIPKEIQKFILKNQVVAFNTRGGRFNYRLEELDREKNSPGPGSYSPDTSLISNNKKIINVNNENTNTNITNNNISSITNNISSVNRSYQSTNNNTSRAGRLMRKTKSFNSDYRNESIPSKGSLGYDIDQNGDKKIIISSKEFNYLSGEKDNSVGPGDYNIQSNWEKNAIPWIRTKDDKDEKYNFIRERKNLLPITQLEKDYLANNERNKFRLISKPRTENNSLNSKAKLFNYIMNLRYDKVRKINEKKDSDDFIFEGSPGPGYYSPENNFSQLDNHFINPRIRNNFSTNQPRFKTVNKSNNNVGPGFYYNKSKPKKIEKPNYIKGTLRDRRNKESDLCALKLSLAKENYDVPGPGSYDVGNNLIHEEVSNNNQNFGVNERRFKNIKEDNDYPGPGAYEKKDIFSKNNERNENKNKNVYMNHKTDLDLIKELSKLPKEEYSTPGVGLYNPSIISSMEYNAKSKVNPYVDEKHVGFGIQEKKGLSFIVKENNRNIGPGRYYKNKKIDLKQNSAPFNLSNKRFNYDQSYSSENPGPGSYDLNSNDDWNKKSHNILFV